MAATASVSVRSDAAEEDAEGVGNADRELTEEDQTLLEMIAQMNDEAEAHPGAGAEEDAGDEGGLERIANRESLRSVELETGGILDRVAETGKGRTRGGTPVVGRLGSTAMSRAGANFDRGTRSSREPAARARGSRISGRPRSHVSLVADEIRAGATAFQRPTNGASGTPECVSWHKLKEHTRKC